MAKYVSGKYFTGEPCKKGHVASRLVYNGQCVQCKKITDRKYNVIASKKYKLAINYGLVEEDVTAMSIAQHGMCAICQDLLAPKHGTQIDHCHKTGKVRGLLCNHCNRLLGSARDSVQILQAAILYLEVT